MTASHCNRLLSELLKKYSRLILKELGLPVRANGTVQCACPVHGGSNGTGFSYDPRRGIWSCWTHHCHERLGRGLIGLTAGVRGCSKEDAALFLIDLCKIDPNELSTEHLDRKLFILNKTNKDISINNVALIDSILDGVNHNVEYFLARGFLQETLNKVGAFYCDRLYHPMYGRACLPIYNDNDIVVGITGRKTPAIPNDDRKWKHYPQNFSTGQVLFGLNKAKEFIKETGVANIVEGPLDQFRMLEAGFPNTVAVLSNCISIDQIRLLRKYGCKTIALLFDPDKGGDIGHKNVEKQCRLFFNVVDLRKLLDNDPGDQVPEALNKSLSAVLTELTERQSRYL